MKSIVVLYHSDCPDGFGAAWAAWKKFGRRAEYIAVDPRMLPQKTMRRKMIYVLDNSLSKSDLRKILENKNKIVVIDHHKTSENDVRSAPEYVLDLDHSGAVLSWNYFHPWKAVPLMLRYVEDVDLWRWRLPQVHEITAYMYAQKFEFATWEKMDKVLATKKGKRYYRDIGKIIMEYEGGVIDAIVSKSEKVIFGGHKALAVNSPIKKFTSEVGHRLCRKNPPFSIVWYAEKGELHVSLRGNGNFDVSKIAARFNGGGHRDAAGFSVPFRAKLPWRVLKTQQEK